MLWELLDPSIQQTSLLSENLLSSPQILPETSIRVTTNFLHPWKHDQLERREIDHNAVENSDLFTFNQEDLQGLYMDNGFFHLDFGNFAH